MTDFTEEQIKAALIRNNGWNGGGVWSTPVKKSSKVIKLSLLLLILGVFFCREIPADNDPAPVFELRSTFKGQPNYIIRIFPDGKVHYHGYTVAVVGDRYAELTQIQLNELIIYFLSLPFEVSKKYEMKRGNLPIAQTIDYKEVYASVHLNDPLFFTVLIKKIDKLINIRQWLCFPKGHKGYENCVLRDDLPDDIESYFK